MDFYDLKNNRKLLSLATCDILGVSIKKEFEKEIPRVVVSYDKGRHSDLGIEIAHAFSNFPTIFLSIIFYYLDIKILITLQIESKSFNLQGYYRFYKKTPLLTVSDLLYLSFIATQSCWIGWIHF
jgi:hypothetical protein